jgi:hypothetical protein
MEDYQSLSHTSSGRSKLERVDCDLRSYCDSASSIRPSVPFPVSAGLRSSDATPDKEGSAGRFGVA